MAKNSYAYENNLYYAKNIGLDLAIDLPKSSGHSEACVLYYNNERSVCSFDIADIKDRKMVRDFINTNNRRKDNKDV